MEHTRVTHRLLIFAVVASTALVGLTGCAGGARPPSAPHPAAASTTEKKVAASAPMVSDFKGFTSGVGFHGTGATAAPGSCSLTAVPAPARPQSSSSEYPPGEAPQPGFTAVTQAWAVLEAHDAAAKYTGTPAPATAPTAVTEESYGTYLATSGQTDSASRIDPTRCVWVVVVDSAITIPHPPAEDGSMQTGPLSQFSVVFDVATGFTIEFSAEP